MENLDAKVSRGAGALEIHSAAGGTFDPRLWLKTLTRHPQARVAWIHALGRSQIQTAHGMMRLWKEAGAQLPVSFESHLQKELQNGELLCGVIAAERRFWMRDPSYPILEARICQGMLAYVLTLLGFAQRQTFRVEAQYCTAALSLESRVFRHYSELSREYDLLELREAFSMILQEEMRHTRIAQSVLRTLPRESRGIYRIVRAFEEMLFERLSRKVYRELRAWDPTERPMRSFVEPRLISR